MTAREEIIKWVEQWTLQTKKGGTLDGLLDALEAEAFARGQGERCVWMVESRDITKVLPREKLSKCPVCKYESHFADFNKLLREAIEDAYEAGRRAGAEEERSEMFSSRTKEWMRFCPNHPGVVLGRDCPRCTEGSRDRSCDCTPPCGFPHGSEDPHD